MPGGWRGVSSRRRPPRSLGQRLKTAPQLIVADVERVAVVVAAGPCRIARSVADELAQSLIGKGSHALRSRLDHRADTSRRARVGPLAPSAGAARRMSPDLPARAGHRRQARPRNDSLPKLIGIAAAPPRTPQRVRHPLGRGPRRRPAPAECSPLAASRATATATRPESSAVAISSRSASVQAFSSAEPSTTRFRSTAHGSIWACIHRTPCVFASSESAVGRLAPGSIATRVRLGAQSELAPPREAAGCLEVSSGAGASAPVGE